jgi:hypothetical protein
MNIDIRMCDMADIADVPCVCTAEFCGHASGERCGKPVRVKLKISMALGDSEFGQETEAGICDECWERVQKQLPQLFH